MIDMIDKTNIRQDFLKDKMYNKYETGMFVQSLQKKALNKFLFKKTVLTKQNLDRIDKKNFKA